MQGSGGDSNTTRSQSNTRKTNKQFISVGTWVCELCVRMGWLFSKNRDFEIENHNAKKICKYIITNKLGARN